IIALFVFSFASSVLLVIAQFLLLIFVLLVLIDHWVLYSRKNGIEATRRLPERMSNGDDNIVLIDLINNYSFKTSLRIIDELPVQFQQRNFQLHVQLNSGEKKNISYSLRPLERG